MLIISPEGPHKSEKVSEKVAGGLQHKLLQGRLSRQKYSKLHLHDADL